MRRQVTRLTPVASDDTKTAAPLHLNIDDDDDNGCDEDEGEFELPKLDGH